jgi:tRNA threonylcarbamoyl adenosine modification protein (Sua5/YciO/YrdC/YwlC family)
VNRLPFRDPEDVLAAAVVVREALATGGVVVVPTESFYGLAADPRNADGVHAVCALKGRPHDMGLPVLCADWQQVENLVRVPDRFRVKLSRLWPAAVTAVLPTLAPTPAALGGSLAVRIPDHGALRALLYRVGPVTGTSANRHGEPPSVTVDGALASLTGPPAAALDGGSTAGGDPSTLVDLTGDEPRTLRPGRVQWEDPYPEL